MFTNYLKTAFRNLWKNKTFSLLNIIGLAVGIACAAIIFLWVEDEITYNNYFENKKDLYQVFENQTYNGQTFTFAATPGLLAGAMKEEIPGVYKTARTTWRDRKLLAVGEKNIYGNGIFADPSFISMFSLKFIKGTEENAFTQLHSIVLTEAMAKKLFNAIEVLGKVVKFDNKQEYIVSGVIKDLPQNNVFSALEWLTPFEVFFKENEWLQRWGNNGIQTYVQLDEKASIAIVNKKLHGFIKEKEKEAIANPFLLSANDWRLRNNFVDGKQSGGRIRQVKLFSIIAWIILLIACINFMNLATARSEKRAKEVSVRKVMGSGRRMLIVQFLMEAVLMAFIAVVLSVAITALALPAFNHLIEKDLSLDIFKPVHFGSLIIIGLLCGLIAGSYPAFYLGSFNPILVLKGLKLRTAGGAAFIRKGLVVIQFTVSVIFIICTIVIYRQVIHTKNRQLGIDKNNLINMSQQLITMKQEGDMGLRFRTIKNELLATGVVENTSLSNSTAFYVNSNSSDFKWNGQNTGKEVLISMEWATPGYIPTMGMKLMAGRDFYQDGMADSNNVVINETMAKLITKKPVEAIGQLIDRDDKKLAVIGVIKDFVYNNVYGAAAPVIIFNDAKAEATSNLTVRFKAGVDYTAALSKVEAVIKKYNPEYPFEYKFVDATFENLFKGESLTGTLASLFAGLAIFISCLGLFGLAAYTAERRIREIGIRKVLGASVTNLTTLLSKEFLMLVVISCVIAFPIAWYFMNSWLQSYEYRVGIQWWMFALPAMVAITIAFATVSFQAIKAAIANPVKSLRTE
jgi:putative ABC transport system permease protein